MKQNPLIIIFFICAFSCKSFSQSSYIQTDFFYGNNIAHSPDAHSFLQGHPTGFFLSYNKRNSGDENWHEHLNYPDVGISASYQNFQSSILGELYALYGHYNFYLTNRLSKSHLILRTALGLAYNTNPYDKITNNKNIALSTHLNTATYIKLYFQRDEIIPNIGINAGLIFSHTSNANIKSPNTGTNIWATSFGLNFNLDNHYLINSLMPSSESRFLNEKIKLNIVLRGGVNESEIIGSGMQPFFVASSYIDKRLSRISALQFGADLYISPMLKDYYNIHQTIPHTNLKKTDSFSRVGLFIGHELFINSLSLETQLGYYLKYPFKYQGRIYETIGLKYYLNSTWFTSLRMKAHGANAETIELGIGIRI